MLNSNFNFVLVNQLALEENVTNNFTLQIMTHATVKYTKHFFLSQKHYMATLAENILQMKMLITRYMHIKQRFPHLL